MGHQRVWWVLPLIFGVIGIGCCAMGVFYGEWMVLQRVGRTGGSHCEVIGTPTGTTQRSSLWSGDFCMGDYLCRVEVLILVLFAFAGVFLLTLSVVYGLVRYLMGRSYDFVFNAGLIAAVCMLDLVWIAWIGYASRVLELPHVDYRCSGLSFYLYVGGTTMASFAFGILHLPSLNLMTERPPLHAHKPLLPTTTPTRMGHQKPMVRGPPGVRFG